MALADDPEYLICHMFKRERRGKTVPYLESFEEGFVAEGIPLDNGERVYGICKQKYFFTPKSLIVKKVDKVEKIYWRDITRCTTDHGQGGISKLTLGNQETVKVNLDELGAAWGRLSQLYHMMIKRWGHQVKSGEVTLSIDSFFKLATTDDCIGANRFPLPSLNTTMKLLKQIESHPRIKQLAIRVRDYEGEEPNSDSILIATKMDMDELKLILEKLEFSGLFRSEGQNEIEVADDSQIYVCVWD